MGVQNVHDLHIWAVEPRLVMLTCHILIEPEREQSNDALLETIREMIVSDFGIHHHTIQLETRCTEPDTVHCDLNRLTNGEMNPSHQPRSFFPLISSVISQPCTRCIR